MPKTRLFLDDYRLPYDCAKYMYKTLSKGNFEYLEEWQIVRNYPEFIKWIEENGLPDLVSFDHDLADGHYHKNMQEGYINYNSNDFESDDYNKTGYHCAKWLINYCINNDKNLPEYFVHSMNTVGATNIHSLLENFKKYSQK